MDPYLDTTNMEVNHRIHNKGDPTHDTEKSRTNQSEREVPSSQGLDRYIPFAATIAFDATLQSSWEALSVSFNAGLLNGGPTALVWGTLLCIFGSTALAASLGEMASITPVVGAQYRWTALYAPKKFMSPAFWSLLQGWITVFAWMAVCAQVCFLEGTIIQGLILLNDNSYIPQPFHGTLLAWAILALPLFCNIFARKILAPLEIIGGVLHIALFVVFIVVLVVFSPRSTSSFVFTTTTTGLSGWSSPGIQWCVGLLSGAFPLAAFDGVLHMSAEVKDAPRRVPQSMVASVAINGAMAWAFIITVLYCIGNLQDALSGVYIYPIIEILYSSTGSKSGTTALMALIVFLGIIAMFSTLASVSRLTWAFARDKGLPFSNFFSQASRSKDITGGTLTFFQVHPGLRIPLNSLMLVTFIVMLLNLINLGSTTAFFALLSLNTLALYISYIIPILFFIMSKLRNDDIPYGPFRLGKFGLPINIFALVYAIFISIFLPFPPFVPVTAASMNYGGPVMAFVIFFAIADWFVTGRKRFQVPVDPVYSAEMDETRG